MEIERKYEVKHLPGDLGQYSYKNIEQGYLCHNPTVRIRKSNDEYILTYKARLKQSENNSAIINHEVELPLTREAYESLKYKTEGNIIHKTRFIVPLADGLMAELDIFDDNLSGLRLVEVEFPDEAAANRFVPPEWFGKELSSDKRFTNYHLSNCQKPPVI